MSSDNEINFTEVRGETELTPPELYAANLIEWAIDHHSSDLFVSDLEDVVRISVRRMGRVETVRHLARDYGRRLQSHLRVLGGADVGNMIHPTEGRGVVRMPNGGAVDLRMSCMPTLFGQDVAIRLFDPVSGARAIEQLGYDEHELATVKKLLQYPAGLILVAGPTASGKSSSLYAMLQHLNDGSRKIHTLEDPIEHSLSGIMQSQINLRAHLDFADLLSVVLRHSPDVIMVGEIRDARTAAAAIRAGSTGQLVFATIHAKTAPEAIDSMLQYECNPQFLGSSLIAVINQRLIRTVCTECCREVELGEVQVRHEILERLGKSPTTQRVAVGCDKCFNDGYDALSTLSEMMVVDEELTHAIGSSLSAQELGRIACERGMLSLEDAAVLRVLRGDTTSAEALSVANKTMLGEWANAAIKAT